MPESRAMVETQDTVILPPRANPELVEQGTAEAELMTAFRVTRRHRSDLQDVW